MGKKGTYVTYFLFIEEKPNGKKWFLPIRHPKSVEPIYIASLLHDYTWLFTKHFKLRPIKHFVVYKSTAKSEGRIIGPQRGRKMIELWKRYALRGMKSFWKIYFEEIRYGYEK